MLNDLQPQQAERHEALPTMERVQLGLQVICEVTTRLVVLIDDAQVLLEQGGELSSGWQQFLNGVIEHNHQATLFLATRVWPGWTERKDSYLVQTDLETLSPETCIEVWERLGYVDEREDTLRKAAELCGYNPRMMEIVAQYVAKPVYSFGWSSWHEPIESNEREGLARFIKNPHYLSSARIDAYPLLDEIITMRLSPDARQLLAVLAVSALPLPAPLLTYLTEHPKRCVKELVRSSLLARDPDRLHLLPLVSESSLQQLSQKERESIEQRLITAYQHWIQEGSKLSVWSCLTPNAHCAAGDGRVPLEMADSSTGDRGLPSVPSAGEVSRGKAIDKAARSDVPAAVQKSRRRAHLPLTCNRDLLDEAHYHFSG